MIVVVPEEVFLTKPLICGFRKRLQKFRKLPENPNLRSELCVADAVDVTGEVEHLVGEAPFIVIPCNELYEVAVESDTAK